MTSLLDSLTDPARHVTPDPLTVLRRENAELTSKVERLEGELKEAKAEAFRNHLDYASAVVGTWPAWKRRLLG